MGTLSFIGDPAGFLLDTSTFLRASRVPEKLGKLASAVIEDPEAKLFLSSISAYEITNKHRLGKLDDYEFVVENYTEIARRLGVIELPVSTAHSYLAGSMDWAHRDPFDRILLAQAALENLAIITDDAQIKAHNWVETVW
ncbi:MAG: type II toxin-antitoxin system VapC family toxin [Coriobacteriales bacterium]|jgi:PIN domain nuclease of toxin-antitoxin system|nr:type II toxin-antitoxin system VapC family toxin [Coriobacteriales bacterium]